MTETKTIVAENGTVVEPGGVYLTFSGNPDTPYCFAKVISIGGRGASIGAQVGPDLIPLSSPDLWAKLYVGQSATPPARDILPDGAFRIIPISVAMFLAWGPPKFPIRIGIEAVTSDELAARVDDWYLRDEPGVAPGPDRG